MTKFCIVIPHYNHERQFLEFLPSLEALGLPCIIVDDGSSEDSVQAVMNYVAGKPNIHLFRHSVNRGKGAAVRTALFCASSLGYTHALQIDADGQHDANDIGNFLNASRDNPTAMICGRPVFDDSVPKIRLHGRKITTVVVALETLSLQIKDGLCGFRVYPLEEVIGIFDHYYLGPRMDFDTELLVKAVWMNIPLKFIPTKVVYPEASVSHFKYWRDNLVLIHLHTRLILGMLVRSPWLLLRRLKGLMS